VVEELPQLVLRDARSVVADLQRALGQPDLDHAAGRAVRGGVVEHVVDRAAEPVRRPGDHARCDLRAEARRTLLPRGTRDRAGHQGVQRHLLDRRIALVAAGQLDEIAHQPAELLRLLRHVAQQRAPLALLELSAGAQDLYVGPQRGHGRAQLVRRVGHEPALRGP